MGQMKVMALLRGSCLALFTGLRFPPWCCRALLRSAFPSCRPWCPAAVLTQMPTGGIPQKQSGLRRAHSNGFCFIVVEVVTMGLRRVCSAAGGGFQQLCLPQHLQAGGQHRALVASWWCSPSDAVGSLSIAASDLNTEGFVAFPCKTEDSDPYLTL